MAEINKFKINKFSHGKHSVPNKNTGNITKKKNHPRNKEHPPPPNPI